MQASPDTLQQLRPNIDVLVVRDAFLASLENADHHDQPYNYWLLNDAMMDIVAEAVTQLPFAPPPVDGFTGTREANNAQRAFFNSENQQKHRLCLTVAEALNHPDVVNTLHRITGAKLDDASLRIEYCQDTQGFWLEPHTDIAVKRITVLIYLGNDPALADAGTDVHEGPPGFKHVATAPYGRGKGLVFVPGKNTWHSVRKRQIPGIRQSLIINWVGPEWRAKDELV